MFDKLLRYWPLIAYLLAVSLSLPSGKSLGSTTVTDAGSVSIPDNEGSFQGVDGETKAAGATGSFSKTVSFPLPKWRELWQSLDLAYDSQSGYSQTGFGWSLSIPSISLDNRRGVPSDDSRLVSSLDGDLVEIADAALAGFGEKIYRARLDSSQNLYIQHGQGKDRSFEVRLEHGLRYIFGFSESAREADGRITASWMLEQVLDRYGNAVVFQYSKNKQVSWLTSIALVNQLGKADESVSYVVELAYEQRPDLWNNWSEGLPQLFDRRLREITSYHVASELSLGGLGSVLSLVEKHRMEKMLLTYAQSGPTSRSMLQSVARFGEDDEHPRPTLTFHYAEDKAEKPAFSLSTYSSESLGLSKVPFFHLLKWSDLNNDGLTDIIGLMDGRWQVWYNLGPERGFAAPEALPIDTIDLNAGGADILVDVNHDYVPDLINWKAGAQKNYVQLSAGSQAGIWGSEKAEIPGLNFKTNNKGFADWVDFNNDRAVDLVSYAKRGSSFILTVRPNQGAVGAMKFASESVQFDLGDRVESNLSNLEWMDVNGDGIEDLYYWQQGSCKQLVGLLSPGYLKPSPGPSTETWPKQRYRVIDSNASCATLNTDTSRLADLNGDGYPDLISFAAGFKAVKIFYNNGTDFVAGIDFENPLLSRTRFLELADMNGNGSTDLVLLQNDGSIVTADLLAPTSKAAPYLMTEVESSLGTRTVISYQSFRNGPYAAHYETGGLPYTIQVVSRIENYSSKTSLTAGYQQALEGISEWDYEDSRFDTERREFLGFRSIVHRNYHDASLRRYTQTSSDYYTSEESGLLRGLPKRSCQSFKDLDNESADDPDYETIESTGSVRQLIPGHAVYYPFLSRTTNRTHDKGKSLITQETFEPEFNSLGQLITTTAAEYGEGQQVYRSHVTRFQQAHGSEDWFPELPLEELTLNGKGDILTRHMMDYDEHGSLIKLEKQRNKQLQIANRWQYDAVGNMVRETDAKDGETRFFFDDAGHFQPTRLEQDAGQITLTTRLTWDGRWAEPTQVIDPNQDVMRREYNGWGLLSAVYRNQSQQPLVQYEYALGDRNRMSYLTQTSSGHQGKDIQYYDSQMRLVAHIKPGESGYFLENYQVVDFLGRPTASGTAESYSFAQPLERWVPNPGLTESQSWDHRHRPLQLRRLAADSSVAGFQVESFAYDLNRTIHTDAVGGIKIEIYDPFDRIVETQNQAGTEVRTVGAEYDELDRIRLLTLKGQAPRSYQWDEFNNLVSLKAETGEKTFEYGPRGELVTEAHYDSDRAFMGSYSYRYDALGRLLEKHEWIKGRDGVLADSLMHALTYDRLGSAGEDGKHRLGRLARLCLSDSSCYTYDYDEQGLVTRKVLALSRSPLLLEMGYDYEQDGRLKGLRYPNGQAVSFTYSDWSGRPTSLSSLVSEAAYDGIGRLEKLRYSNNFEQNFAYYKNLGTISQISSRLQDGVYVKHYSYDGERRLLQESGQEPWYSSLTKSYQYDLFGDLTHASFDVSDKSDRRNERSFDYDYNEQGLISKKNGSPVLFQYGATALGSKRLEKRTAADSVFDFDPAGRVEHISGPQGEQALSWSPDDRLKDRSYADGSHTEYVYQPDNERFAELQWAPQAAKPKRIVYFDELYHYDEATGQGTSFYPFEGVVVGSRSDGEELPRYFMHNHQGSVIGEVDGSGQVLHYRDYDPYGDLIAWGDATAPETFGFAGALYDSKSSGYQMRNRHYQTEAGSFASADPYFLMTPSACLESIVEAHLYSYAGNDPINYADPSGLARNKFRSASPKLQMMPTGSSNASSSTSTQATTPTTTQATTPTTTQATTPTTTQATTPAQANTVTANPRNQRIRVQTIFRTLNWMNARAQSTLDAFIRWVTHVEPRHVPGHDPQGLNRGGSMFFRNTTFASFVNNIFRSVRVSRRIFNGRLVRIFRSNRPVGYDVRSGNRPTVYTTVVTRPNGSLVTAHPGLP